MNGQAGKGDKLRKGANLKAYWENYDQIFRNPRKTMKEWQKYFNHEITDFSGFKEYNSDDMLTENEYKSCLTHCQYYLHLKYD